MKCWYAVNTHPREEHRALGHLARQGIEAYLPRFLKRRRHARRVEWIAAPLFPSYLFVRFDIDVARWRAVQSTVGVRRLVCFGDLPTPVPEGIVEALRARQDDKGWIVLGRGIDFKKGQPVQIADGPFAEHAALFECQDDRERVTLLLTLMGREVRVRVPLRAVRPLH